MARYLVPILIVLVSLWSIMTALTGGCMSEVDRQPPGPAEVPMAVHISNVHKVRIGEDSEAHIVVFATNDLVRVRLSDDLLKRVYSDFMMVLRFESQEKTFDRQRYLMFLDQLHAYLMLTPLRTPAPWDSDDNEP